MDGLLKVIKYGYLIITQPTLMMDVDDPSERVGKSVDEILKTKTRFQHYRPQTCPHFTHIRLFNDNNN